MPEKKEEIMRLISQSELLRATKLELHVLLRSGQPEPRTGRPVSPSASPRVMQQFPKQWRSVNGERTEEAK
jgi:hypothetical protein